MAKDIEASGPEAGEFSAKDYTDPPPAPLIDAEELTQWSLYRAVIAEFIATLLFLYITVATVIGYKHQTDAAASGADTACGGLGQASRRRLKGHFLYIKIELCNFLAKYFCIIRIVRAHKSSWLR